MAYSTKKMTDRMIKKLQSKLAKTPSNLTNQKNRIKQQISKLRTEERTRESKRAHAAPKRKSEQFRQPPLTGTSGKTSTAAGSVKRRPGQPSAASKSIPTLRPSTIASRKAKPASVKKPSGAGTRRALEKLQGNRSITKGLVIKDETKRAKSKHVTNPLTKVPSRRPKEGNLKKVPSRRKTATTTKKRSESNLKKVPSRRRPTKAAKNESNLKKVRSRRQVGLTATQRERVYGVKKKPAKKKAAAKKKPAKRKSANIFGPNWRKSIYAR